MCSACYGAEIIQQEEFKNHSIQIVDFNGHRYVHLINHWSSAGNFFIHDPDCPCIIKAVKAIQDRNKS
jgi:hypothetical protein